MNQEHRNEVKTQVFEDYDSKMSVNQICFKYNIKKSSIYSWLSSREAQVKDITIIYTNKERDIIALKAISGMKVKSICDEYQLRPSTVYLWIKKYKKCVLSSQSKPRRYSREIISNLHKMITILKSVSTTNDMTKYEKHEVIHSLRDQYSIKMLCEALDYNRSTYYYHQRTGLSYYEKRDQILKKEIMEVFLKHKKRIGGAKIRKSLMDKGIQVGYKKIYNLMQDIGIKPQIKKKAVFIRPPKRTNENCKNLLNQQFTQKYPNIVWVSDITEIKINQKPVYLCAILDLFSRKIISYQVSRKNNTRLSLYTFNQALLLRKTKPHMFHSDRGVQYTSEIFQSHLRKHEVTQSFSAPGYPYDNSVMESFFSSYKKEAIHNRQPFRTIQDYIKMVDEYMNYYNTIRYHKGIGLLTPNKKELLFFSNNFG
ncbi:MAG: IS3 family transposase [Firmicutes bacterium]|nr:IS3 family transposase [Bacillota bacterium]